MTSLARWFRASAPSDGSLSRGGSGADAPVDPTPRWKMTIKLLAFVAIGALAGFAYHKLIGCRTGACPITANPYISTVYGAVMGFLLSGGIR